MTIYLFIYLFITVDPYQELKKYIATRDHIHLFNSSFFYIYKFLVGELVGPIERRRFLQAIMKWGLNTNNEWCGWQPLRVAHYCVSHETLAPILQHPTTPGKPISTWTTATSTGRPKTLEEVTANIFIPPTPPPPPMVDLSKKTKGQRPMKLCLTNRRRLELIKKRIKSANKCIF